MNSFLLFLLVYFPCSLIFTPTPTVPSVTFLLVLGPVHSIQDSCDQITLAIPLFLVSPHTQKMKMNVFVIFLKSTFLQCTHVIKLRPTYPTRYTTCKVSSFPSSSMFTTSSTTSSGGTLASSVSLTPTLRTCTTSTSTAMTSLTFSSILE